MQPQQVLFTLVTFLHDLFSAAWVGGLMTMALTVMPVVRSVLKTSAQTKTFMEALQRRLSIVVYVSMVGLALTGLFLTRRVGRLDALLRFDDLYGAVLSVKHLLMISMVALSLLRSVALLRAAKRVTAQTRRWRLSLVYVNLALGVLVLLASALITALGAAPPSASLLI